MKKGLKAFRRSLLTMLCCMTMICSTMSSLAVYADETDQVVTEAEVVTSAPDADETEEPDIPEAEPVTESESDPVEIPEEAVEITEDGEIDEDQLPVEEDNEGEEPSEDADTEESADEIEEPSEEHKSAEDVKEEEGTSENVGTQDSEQADEDKKSDAEKSVEQEDAQKSAEENAEKGSEDAESDQDEKSAGGTDESADSAEDADADSDELETIVESEELEAMNDAVNASGVTVDVDGIKYTLTTSEDGTATITGFGLPDGVTTSPETVNIPGTITTEDGTEYTVTDMNVLTAPRPYFTNTTTLTFPDTLTKISQGNLSQFRAITELTIPGNVTSYTGVMSGCKALQRVTFEEGVKEIKANGNLFGGSYSSPNNTLEEVSLPSTLESFSGGFDYCTKIKSVTFPDGVILNNQFSMTGCTSLTEFTYPASSTMITGSAFLDCTSLQKVTAKGTITKVGAAAFENCTALTEIPDLSAVTEMFQYAFYNCPVLKAEVDLSSLDQIPNRAFGYSPVTVTAFSENLTSIGTWAFINATIAAEAFPDQLESIGSYAFYYAQFPSTFTLPDSLTTVSSGAFSKATGVRTLYVGTTQTGLKSLDTAAFDGVLFGTVYIAASKDEFTYKDSDQFTKVIYLYEAVDAEDDKISSDADAMTLQEAVNAAAAGNADGVNVLEGGIVVLKKNVRLHATLNVPAGNPVTIQSEDGQTYTIIGPKDSSIDNLVEVESGADITYINVNLVGRYNKKSVISTVGKVTLGKDVTINNATITDSSTGVIDVNGNNASLVINGATIKNNTISAQYSATVLVRNGASIDMQDGTITNNKYTIKDAANGTSGILMLNGTKGSMSGGTISYNTARRGAAIMLRNEDGADRITFEMTGGSIANNKATSGTTDTSTAGGAIYLNGNAQFTMQDGEIKDNTSEYHGGGVTVVDWRLQNNRGDNNTAFIMNGGTISGNTASAGGGIYSYANGTVLNAGSITHNSANKGGALYVEGNSKHYSRTHLYNVVVTDNTAEDNGVGDIHGIGGGLWLCPTGDAKVYIKNGGVLNGNTAERSGDDIAAAASSGSNYSLTLANRIMGGGKVSWMTDGTLFGSFVGSADPRSDGTNRYDKDADPAPQPTVVEDSKTYQTLHSAITETDLENANKQAKLFITDNTAQQGAGIATNGGLTIGEANPIDIKVVKKWDTAAGTTIPESIEVQLLRDGVAYRDAVTLNAENEWSYTWKQVEDGYEWSVKEVNELSGYVVTVDKDTDTGLITLTLTNTETVNVEVNKVWDAAEGTTTPDSIKVQLLKNGEAEGKPVTLNKENNWSYAWKDLAAKYTWTIEEVEVPEGYRVNISDAEVTGNTLHYTITNTEIVNVKVTKVWDAPEGTANPTSIDVQLMKDGKAEGKAVTLSKENDWTYTWENLVAKYTWTVEEVEVPEGFTVNVKSETTEDGTIAFTITNTKNPELTNIKVTKVWDAPEGTTTPESVTVQLMKDGKAEGKAVTLNKENDWTYTWKDLLAEHEWTIKEVEVPEGYVVNVTSKTTDDGDTDVTITNTYVEEETVDVSVKKVWRIEDGSKAPESVTVQLMKDGKAEGKAVTLNKNNDWSYSWKELETGHDWTVEEVNVPDGYIVSMDKQIRDDQVEVTITNTKTPEKPEKPGKPGKPHEGGHGKINLYKVDGQTNKPIAGAVFALYKSNGDYVGTYTTDANGHIEIPGADASTYYFTEVKAPEGYTLDPTYLRFSLASEQDLALKFTNTKPEVPTTMIGGTKTWVGDTEANRPDSITLHLLANGVEVGTVSTNAAQNWVYAFGAQAIKDANGNAITYTVTEDAVSGYETEIAEAVQGDGCIVINVTNTWIGETGGGYIGSTGDESHMMAYAGIMAAAVAGLAGWFIVRRRRDS